jgi:hypothetical protein
MRSRPLQHRAGLRQEEARVANITNALLKRASPSSNLHNRSAQSYNAPPGRPSNRQAGHRSFLVDGCREKALAQASAHHRTLPKAEETGNYQWESTTRFSRGEAGNIYATTGHEKSYRL